MNALKDKPRTLLISVCLLLTQASIANTQEAPLAGADDPRSDAQRGLQIFRARCSVCHTIEKSAGNAAGPNLYGIMDRGQATRPDYQYSEALLKEKDTPWTFMRLENFLRSPRKFSPGTNMNFPGLSLDSERKAVIHFLSEQ